MKHWQKQFVEKFGKDVKWLKGEKKQLVKIEVDCVIPSLGGFMKLIIVKVPQTIANNLKGKSEPGGGRYRDNFYWDAVTHVKGIIAAKVGIGPWRESITERTQHGDNKAPIGIISLRAVKDGK